MGSLKNPFIYVIKKTAIFVKISVNKESHKMFLVMCWALLCYR